MTGKKLEDGDTTILKDCADRLLGIRLVVEGRVPDGPVLIAMKHQSFYEAIYAPGFFERPAVFAKAELTRIPVWGWIGQHYGLVAVRRDQGASALRKMLASARAFSADGRPLVIFPEGTRVPFGQRRELQAGFAGLYKMLGLPVVPVAGKMKHCPFSVLKTFFRFSRSGVTSFGKLGER